MAKRLFTSAGLSFAASNAGATATAGSYMALKGGSGTQLIDVLEVVITGKAAASAIGGIYLARASTLETTPTALAAPHSDGFVYPNATTLGGANPISFVTAATQTTPSNTVTDAKLDMGLNLFGGIYRWNAAPTQQWQMLGNTAPGGESVLWNNALASGQTGLADAHILYEPY